jgi:hypothetical protein
MAADPLSEAREALRRVLVADDMLHDDDEPIHESLVLVSTTTREARTVLARLDALPAPERWRPIPAVPVTNMPLAGGWFYPDAPSKGGD